MASRLNNDEQLYKEAKINVQKLIKNKTSTAAVDPRYLKVEIAD